MRKPSASASRRLTRALADVKVTKVTKYAGRERAFHSRWTKLFRYFHWCYCYNLPLHFANFTLRKTRAKFGRMFDGAAGKSVKRSIMQGHTREQVEESINANRAQVLAKQLVGRACVFVCECGCCCVVLFC